MISALLRLAVLASALTCGKTYEEACSSIAAKEPAYPPEAAATYRLVLSWLLWCFWTSDEISSGGLVLAPSTETGAPDA